MSKFLKFILCTGVAIFVGVGLAYSAMVIETTGKMNRNVQIANTDVSGMTKQKAYARIKSLLEKKQNAYVLLKMGSFQKNIRLIGTIEETNLLVQLDKAYDHGKNGNFLKNILVWLTIKEDKGDYPLEIKYNEVQINAILENVKNDFINGDKSGIIKRINILTNMWPETSLVEEVMNQEKKLVDGLNLEEIKVIDILGTKRNIKRYLSNETYKDEIEIAIVAIKDR